MPFLNELLSLRLPLASIQLVVIGAGNTAGLGELFGPAGLAALHDTDFSILVVDPQRLL